MDVWTDRTPPRVATILAPIAIFLRILMDSVIGLDVFLRRAGEGNKPKPLLKETFAMNRIFANGFGLIVLTSVSLVNSAFADGPEKGAAAAQGLQQVVISNTAANPVPVAQPTPQYFQATQTVQCAG